MVPNSDEEEVNDNDAGAMIQAEPATRIDKGKLPLFDLTYESVDPRLDTFPRSLISYADWKEGVCYLCGRRYDTPTKLRTHEHSDLHLENLADEYSVQKGMARLQRYGFTQRLREESNRQFFEQLESAINGKTSPRPRTIIRGQDRAVELSVEGNGGKSSDEFVEVSRFDLPQLHVFNQGMLQWVTQVQQSLICMCTRQPAACQVPEECAEE